jgi:Na+/H+ antiporter NhaC
MKGKLLIGFIFSSLLTFGGNGTISSEWLGLIPAVLAISLSVITKEVVLSLFIAVLIGSVLVFFEGGLTDSYFIGLEKSIDHYILNAASDVNHMSIIIFSLLISGMVSVLKFTNGMSGVVNWISKYAKTKRSALFTTYFMGVVIFFDDYANTLIVGNTMKSVTDKFKISREKLAYIVDATAAPIACVALISTWIGAEVQLIDEGLEDNGLSKVIGTGYATFLNAISYSFYPLITLVFIFLLIYMKRDFGKMQELELAQQEITELTLDNKKISPIYEGILPIVVLISISFLGIYITGEGNGFVEHIQSGDSYKGLLWGSSASLTTTILINIKRGLVNNIEWVLKGFIELLPALLVLVLAWSLNSVLQDLELGAFLGELLNNTGLGFQWVPIITFLLASVIAFGTGSSFSTMSILFPIVISVSASFVLANPVEEIISLFYCSVASVLSGAVLGDHCSPISDTTILSSMATGCDHISHVKTQLPYAITVGCMSAVMIVLSTIFNLPPIILIALSIVLSYVIIRILGKKN